MRPIPSPDPPWTSVAVVQAGPCRARRARPVTNIGRTRQCRPTRLCSGFLPGEAIAGRRLDSSQPGTGQAPTGCPSAWTPGTGVQMAARCETGRRRFTRQGKSVSARPSASDPIFPGFPVMAPAPAFWPGRCLVLSSGLDRLAAWADSACGERGSAIHTYLAVSEHRWPTSEDAVGPVEIARRAGGRFTHRKKGW